MSPIVQSASAFRSISWTRSITQEKYRTFLIMLCCRLFRTLNLPVIFRASPRRAAAAARCADIGHDAINEDVADVAVVRVAAEAPTAKEAVEASFDRQIRILVAAVTRVHELPCECMNVGVGHQRRIAADRAHALVPRDEFDHPSAVTGSGVTLTDKCSPMA